ncbi:hypothetical protein ACN8ZM_40460 (plasmid) [Burkholderia aenigmatica]|uniref:hypothetical protein n=1 Tax=Burkholderia aenigmatica TaxID=2015348 RepID=UPI003B433DB9
MIHSIGAANRYLFGEQLPRSVSVNRWQAGTEVFMHRHQPIGMRPRTIGRPDLASSYLEESLIAVRHSALYTLFVCKEHTVVGALELARADPTSGEMKLSPREMKIRRREVVKVAMHGFAAGMMLVMHEVRPPDREYRDVAVATHEMLVEPLKMIDVQLTDHCWVSERGVMSWVAGDLQDFLPAV